MVAEQEGRLAAWVSAYRLPRAPEQLFLWQIAVHPAARGTGLGGRMLDALIERAGCGTTALLTTVTEANAPSWALFGAFARRLGTSLVRRPLFDRGAHFAGAHATEHLVSIALPPRPSPKEKRE